eukprot:1157139-Pelagomonas_calceolata.AAC.3
MGSSTTPARHIHLIKIKYCEDTRPGAQLEASQQQHSKLCKQLHGAEITIHPILLGVGRTVYTAHTLEQFKKLGIDSQRSGTLARKLHAHSVQFAHKLTSTRRAIVNKNTHHNTVALEQRCNRATRIKPLFVRETTKESSVSKTICAACVHEGKTCPKRDFARGGYLRPKIRCYLHAPLHVCPVTGYLDSCPPLVSLALEYFTSHGSIQPVTGVFSTGVFNQSRDTCLISCSVNLSFHHQTSTSDHPNASNWMTFSDLESLY